MEKLGVPQEEIESNGSRYSSLKAFVENPMFALTVAILILLSVFIILIDLFLTLSDEWASIVLVLNDSLTMIFVVELTLRWLVAKSTGQFVSQFWIDIIAVFPMLRIFRIGRVFRLLRLFRLFSLGPAFQRRFTIFNRIFAGQWLEFSIIMGFIFFAVVFGAVGLSQFEMGYGEIETTQDAFWKSLFSLLSGEYADHPETIGGKIVSVILLMFGMGVFAMLTGTFSALMIDKLKENAMHTVNNPEDLNNHIIICGYSSKVAILCIEFMLDPDFKDSDVLIVSEQACLDDLKLRNVNTDRVCLLNEDFTRVETLKKAGVTRAKAAIVLSEAGGHRSTQDIDARSLLAALTIERMNPKIHTSVEIYHEEYTDHLKMGGVEDIVIQGEVSGRLLAKVAMQEGMLTFFKDLLSRQQGNTLIFVPITEDIIGKEFDEAISILHKKKRYIIVGIKRPNQEMIVNPGRTILAKDDKLLVITPIGEE
jgi:voltage-gated potassium channel